MPTSNGKNQEANARKRKEKPIPFKLGSFAATIYVTTKKVDGTEYKVWRPAYYLPDGRRVVRDCGSLERALEILQEVGQAFGRARPDALSFTPEERRDADAAMELLAPHGLSLYAAASTLTEALAALPPGITLLDSARWAATRAPRTDKSVAEVIDEIVKDREANGRSRRYLDDLRSRLKNFGATFKTSITSISPADVRGYLGNLKNPDGSTLAARSKENHRRIVIALFSFAASQRYISKETSDDISAIKGPRVPAPNTEIFTPSEFRRFLEALSGPDLVLAVLGGFCGLRSAELGRLRWENLKLDQGIVVVGADQAKTQSRRTCPIPPCAAAWIALTTPGAPKDQISPHDRPEYLSKHFTKIARRIGLKWPANGMRHSFCSYRLAVTQNTAQVALECGNSPAILFKHYRELVSPAQAAEWFNVHPS
jgi:integrase